MEAVGTSTSTLTVQWNVSDHVTSGQYNVGYPFDFIIKAICMTKGIQECMITVIIINDDDVIIRSCVKIVGNQIVLPTYQV